MKAAAMDSKWWENFVVKVLILIVASAGVTGMLSKESWKKALKNFLAGILAGVVAAIICLSANVSQTWTLIICFVLASFVSSVWPLLGQIAIKKIKQKADGDIPID